MSIQQLLLCDKPKVVPGSQTFNSGSGNFTVPLFNSLTIELWGAGATSAIYNFDGATFTAAADGGDSFITSLSLMARGGKGSVDGYAAPAGGGASGGSTNTGGQPGGAGRQMPLTNDYSATNGGNSGGGAAGGTGGHITLPFFLPPSQYAPGSDGASPGAGAGGSAYWDDPNAERFISASGAGGGYCSRTYLSTGGVVHYQDVLAYVVGSPSYNYPFAGSGGNGRIKFTWS